MSDPEILGPEGASPDPRRHLEKLLAEIQKQLPGRTLKVEVDGDPPRGFHASAAGPKGDLEVSATPLLVTVSFRGARSAFFPGPSVEEEIVRRVGQIVRDEVVVVEHVERPGLRRSTTVRVENGRFVAVEDDGQLPYDGQPDEPRATSFSGAWDRALTKEERRWLAKHTGGFVGKLKRRLIGKVFQKVAQPFLEQQQQGGVRVETDDGRRRLGRKLD
jgi:hypothetical protein